MKNITIFILSFFSIFVFSQNQKTLVFFNAKIYTVDAQFRTAEAMAVIGDKIAATGNQSDIFKKYPSAERIDMHGATVYPGFTDAHAHFFGYGSTLQNADLRGTKSWQEVLEKLKKFAATHPDGWLLGRGWDQNNWLDKNFPKNAEINRLFPNRPVYLTRIDGHAAIANEMALSAGKFNDKSTISGGEFVKENGKLTGMLIDNAKDEMASFIPAPSDILVEKMLLDAQKNCFAAGLTAVEDAGLDFDLVEKIREMQTRGNLKMRMNVMLSDSQKNLDFFQKFGKIKTDRLHVSGFKFYADGALGSRGACLLQDYADSPHRRGFLLSDAEHFRKMARLMYQKNLQMNTHAIGDSANRILLKIYGEVLKGKNDRRWRIEHAQIIDPQDFNYFGKFSIIPSVQPTHATSDMYWAESRLGEKRLKSAYAYKDLLRQNGWIALGTDFPIEEISPILTFYAAVARKDLKGFPAGGFQKENALTREETLRGMTIWAAKAGFDENERGSLEVGKFADFVVTDRDLMTIPEDEIPHVKILQTWSGAEKVYDAASEN